MVLTYWILQIFRKTYDGTLSAQHVCSVQILFSDCFAGSALDHGAMVAMLLSALVSAGWHAAGSDLRVVFGDSMTAYYLLMMSLMRAMKKHGTAWARNFLPLTTLKTLAYVTAHAALACCHWPADVEWRPRARVETLCEFYFSSVKRPFRGSPSLKDGILGCHFHHMQQLRQSANFIQSPRKGEFVTKICPREAAALAEESLKRASDFVAWISVNQDFEYETDGWGALSNSLLNVFGEPP